MVPYGHFLHKKTVGFKVMLVQKTPETQSCVYMDFKGFDSYLVGVTQVPVSASFVPDIEQNKIIPPGEAVLWDKAKKC